ncbi:MAG: MFS transporter [Candidatus Azobacteroides sp.]|nr:MFS transporter [Candidatus Azobacteroides sp.]
MSSSLNLALPHLARAFYLDAVMLSWTVSIYLLASAIFAIPFAKLADIWGRKKVFLTGVTGLMVFSLGCSFVTSELLFLLCRFLQGVSSAMIFGTNMAILIDVFPQKERGKVLGINTSVVYFSAASGPFLGGLLTNYLGWESIFYINAIVGFIIIAGILKFMHKLEWTAGESKKFDLIGAVIYGLGLSILIYGFSELGTNWKTGFVLVVAGLLLITIFAWYENHCQYPVFDVRMFLANRVFCYSSFAALINYAATFGISFMLSLYLQYIKGYDAKTAGAILIIQPVTQGILSVFTGRLSDKVNPGKLATTGMIVIVLALLLMLLLHERTPLFFLLPVLIILGSGFALFSSPNVNVIMSSVEKQYLGMASATTSTMRLAGQSFSMGIVMMIIALIVGKVQISHEVHTQLMESIHLTFIIFAFLCIIGIFFSMIRNKNSHSTALK